LSKPYERIIVLDFETAWGRAVKLGFSCQTNEEYIRDPRFKAWGLCWKDYGSDIPAIWVRGKDLEKWVATIDWTRTAVVAQNAQFDASILAWRYGCQIAFVFDTLSMGRAKRGIEVGNSLKKMAEDFGLEPKGDGLASSENYLDELPFHVEQELSTYCRHDVFLCEEIFKRLVDGYPASELRLIDMTLKMYINPRLELDEKMLFEAIEDERNTREELLTRLGIDDAALASNPKFASVLESMGIEPPTKKSKTTGKTAFALAKNDALFQSLLNGEREDVALLCEARLKVKSTAERTRAQRFLDISSRGALPVPLAYYGAKSGRWAAAKGSAINMQNLKRGSFLRKAIMAPEGYQLAVGDLSQIEPRVLAWLSDYDEMLDIFRSGKDAYATFGAQMFNIPGMTKDSHPIHRQSAKSALLGAGYGLGWASFASQLLTGFLGAPPLQYELPFAKQLGVTKEYAMDFLKWKDNEEKMLEIPHICTTKELMYHCLAAKKIIDIYRSTAYPVVGFWKMCDVMLREALYGGKELTHKCLIFRKEEIELPNGMKLLYPDLRIEKDKETGKSQFVYGPHATKLYPGKITNNVTQALARIVMTDGMLRVSKRYPVVGTVHDELLALVPDAEADEGQKWCLSQMTVVPKYMPGIPLAADGGVNRRYGLAKN
jgi:DNA polymerase III epsilon subunit-like protein